jgi:hypothetical protein
MKKRDTAAIIFSGWLLWVSCILCLARIFSLDLYFSLGFIGFLVAVDFTEMRYVRPEYAGRITWWSVAGLGIFTAILFRFVWGVIAG